MDDERLVFIRDAVIAIVALGVIIYAVRVFYGIPNGKLLAREEGVPFVVKLQGYSPSGSFAYNGLVDGAGSVCSSDWRQPLYVSAGSGFSAYGWNYKVISVNGENGTFIHVG